MPHLPAEKLHQAGDKKAGLGRVLRQRAHRSDQFGSKPLIGVQVQLPRVTEQQVVDGPISLRAIVFKRMLDDLGSMLPAQRDRVICAEGVDNVQVIGNFLRLSQCRP